MNELPKCPSCGAGVDKLVGGATIFHCDSEFHQGTRCAIAGTAAVAIEPAGRRFERFVRRLSDCEIGALLIKQRLSSDSDLQACTVIVPEPGYVPPVDERGETIRRQERKIFLLKSHIERQDGALSFAGDQRKKWWDVEAELEAEIDRLRAELAPPPPVGPGPFTFAERTPDKGQVIEWTGEGSDEWHTVRWGEENYLKPLATSVWRPVTLPPAEPVQQEIDWTSVDVEIAERREYPCDYNDTTVVGLEKAKQLARLKSASQPAIDLMKLERFTIGSNGEMESDKSGAWIGFSDAQALVHSSILGSEIAGTVKPTHGQIASAGLADQVVREAGIESPATDEPKCKECGDKGSVDSGGVTPWGTGIDVPCPCCSPAAADVGAEAVALLREMQTPATNEHSITKWHHWRAKIDAVLAGRVKQWPVWFSFFPDDTPHRWSTGPTDFMKPCTLVRFDDPEPAKPEPTLVERLRERKEYELDPMLAKLIDEAIAAL